MPVNSVNMAFHIYRVHRHVDEFILTSLHYVIKSVTQNGGNLSLVFIYRNSSVIYCLVSLKEKIISETQRILSIVDHWQ